jgi:hypothetical protein
MTLNQTLTLIILIARMASYYNQTLYTCNPYCKDAWLHMKATSFKVYMNLYCSLTDFELNSDSPTSISFCSLKSIRFCNSSL